MTPIEYLIQEYLWDVYKVRDKKIFKRVMRCLPMAKPELEKHVTLVTKTHVLIITACPERLENILVVGEDGNRYCFKVVRPKE